MSFFTPEGVLLVKQRDKRIAAIAQCASTLLSNDSGTLPPINPTNTKIADAVKVAARIYELSEAVVEAHKPPQDKPYPSWQTP